MQCAFQLYERQISLIDALESSDAHFLNEPLDIEVDVFLPIRFDGLHTRIGEINAGRSCHQSIVNSESHLRSPLTFEMSEYDYVAGPILPGSVPAFKKAPVRP